MRIKKKLKIIGYWSGGEEEGYPHPEEFVDKNWDCEEKNLVIQYLDQGKLLSNYQGKSWCRFGCKDIDMGSKEFTDGEFAWPQGFKHYLEVHFVKPPLAFIEKCKINDGKPISEPRFDPNHSNAWWIKSSRRLQRKKLMNVLIKEKNFDQLADFQNFYNNFREDIIYQLEHIEFPIPIFLENYHGNMNTVWLEEDLWQNLGLALFYNKCLSNEEINIINYQIVEFDKGDIEVQFQDSGLGIMVDFQFEKKGEEWQLTGIDDYS
jgi:hypothetical protein